jgi:hypothetical protein
MKYTAGNYKWQTVFLLVRVLVIEKLFEDDHENDRNIN